MFGLSLCSKFFAATSLFLIVNAQTNKRLGHTISNEFRRHLQVDTDLRSLVSDGPFLTGKIDTVTIVPLINLMKNNAWESFHMTLMIPDIRGVDGKFITTGFECENNHDIKNTVALCTVDDDLESILTLGVTLNGNNYLVNGIFDDIMRGVKFQIYTDVSKSEYSYAFSIFKDEDVPMKVEAVSSAALSSKAVPIIGVNTRNEMVNQNRTIVGRVGQSQSDVGINIIEEDTVVKVLFYYTWRAMCQWTNQSYESCTDSEDAKAKIKNLVKIYAAFANEVFYRSLTGVRIEHTFSFGGKEGYDEGAFNDDPLDALNDLTENRVNDVHSLRNKNGADLVVGIVFGTFFGASGIAWKPTTFPSRSQGFSAIMSCGIKCNSIMFSVITHEIGHNFGCGHDREYELISDENEDSNFGFNHCPACLTTIMSYESYCINFDSCDRVKRLPYFSNPDIGITVQGQKFAIGDSKRNNAQMIRNSKKGVAANRFKSQYLLDVESSSLFYSYNNYIDFTIEGVTAVTIKNLEIFMTTSETHKISLSTKLINTEDDYSLHVEENLVPMSQESNVFSTVASFDKFPAIKIGAGETMKIRVACDTDCIFFKVGNDPMLVKDDHILVEGDKDEWDTLFWGAIFYKPKGCKDHKGKFIWKKKKKVNCKWVSKEEKCSKGVAKQYCPKRCGFC